MYNISIRSTVILFFLLVNYSGFLLLLLTSPVPASYLPSLLSSPPFLRLLQSQSLEEPIVRSGACKDKQSWIRA